MLVGKAERQNTQVSLNLPRVPFLRVPTLHQGQSREQGVSSVVLGSRSPSWDMPVWLSAVVIGHSRSVNASQFTYHCVMDRVGVISGF